MKHRLHIVRYVGQLLTSLMLLIVMGLSLIGFQSMGHSCCHGSHLDLSMAGMELFSICMEEHSDACHCHDNSCPCSDKQQQCEVLKLDTDIINEESLKCTPSFVSIIESHHFCMICLNICKPELNTIITPLLRHNPDDWQSVSGVFII